MKDVLIARKDVACCMDHGRINLLRVSGLMESKLELKYALVCVRTGNGTEQREKSAFPGDRIKRSDEYLFIRTLVRMADAVRFQFIYF